MESQFERDRENFERTKNALLAASQLTSDRCPALYAAISAKIDAYVPDPGAAEIIANTALAIKDEFRTFGRLEIDLVSECGTMAGRSHDKVIEAGLDELRRLMNLDTSNRSFDLIAMARMRAVSATFEVSSELLLLHIATLEDALGIEDHDLSMLAQTIAKQLDAIAKELVADGLVELANALVPGIAMMLKVFEKIKNVREKSSKTPLDFNGLNQETYLANLQRRLKIQNDLIKLNIDSLRTRDFP